MKGISFFLLSLILIAFYSCGSSKTIRSGEIWTDTDKNMINAHGGGILYHNGTYYWYGEYKNDSTYHAPGVEWDCYRTEAGGVACYSSKNLQSWKFEGIVLKPDMTDPTSDIHPSMVIERPKVIYNDQTKKFVMWMHIDNYNYSKAAAGVAISDSPTGNFQYLHSLRPGGEESRDMTLFKDEDGKAYHIYSTKGNSTLFFHLLSDDYLTHTGIYKAAFPGKYREAPAIFKRQNKYYLITSGCSGWDPNEAEYAIADSILGEWKTMGNPCIGENANKSFGGQSTFAISIDPKKDKYIIMFDRWNKLDLIDSRYIWLPINFHPEGISIEWKPEWSFKK